MKTVYYPGLESHPHHKVAKSQMKHFSGMISFETVGGKEDAIKLVEVSGMIIKDGFTNAMLNCHMLT